MKGAKQKDNYMVRRYLLQTLEGAFPLVRRGLGGRYKLKIRK